MRVASHGRVPVVGESNYQRALAEAAGGRAAGPDFEDQVPVQAVLVPEPDNQYDSNAVRVDIRGHTVGYLARETALAYQPVLGWLRRRGELGWCPARIAGGPHLDYGYGVYLYLAEPETVIPANQPDGLHLLDADVPVVGTGEERHQDVLEPLLAGNERAAAFAELRLGTVEHGKHVGHPCVEVAINERLVGVLTQAMSARYAPLVKAQVSQGRRVGVEASLYRDAKGVQVRLRLPALRD
jgi:hypothetical protein